MKLNEDKCHFLFGGTIEFMFTEVGDEKIWESLSEKLLGVTVDKGLKFNEHLQNVCKKVSCKITALGRMSRILPFRNVDLYSKRLQNHNFLTVPQSGCSVAKR